jgi:hypothetical protein
MPGRKRQVAERAEDCFGTLLARGVRDREPTAMTRR